jgi:F-type H+-transporting ATPase subunit a
LARSALANGGALGFDSGDLRHPDWVLACLASGEDAKAVNHIEIFRDRVVFVIGPIPVTETMVTTFAVTAALIVVAATLRSAVRHRPYSSLAIVAVMAFEWLETLVRDIVGRSVPWLVTCSGSLLFFIAGCNIAGQLPSIETPAASLATTSALAILVFLMVPVTGIYTRGFKGYMQHYLRPNPLLFPLEVLSEVSRTFALSLRLFGNMMSGHLIVALLVALAGVVVPIPLMALDLLIGLLQAYIFAVLATVYVGAAMRVGEET